MHCRVTPSSSCGPPLRLLGLLCCPERRGLGVLPRDLGGGGSRSRPTQSWGLGQPLTRQLPGGGGAIPAPAQLWNLMTLEAEGGGSCPPGPPDAPQPSTPVRAGHPALTPTHSTETKAPPPRGPAAVQLAWESAGPVRQIIIIIVIRPTHLRWMPAHQLPAGSFFRCQSRRRLRPALLQNLPRAPAAGDSCPSRLLASPPGFSVPGLPSGRRWDPRLLPSHSSPAPAPALRPPRPSGYLSASTPGGPCTHPHRPLPTPTPGACTLQALSKSAPHTTDRFIFSRH